MLKTSFDEILTHRIEFGRAQIEQFLVISLIDFIDGFQEIMMGVLIAIFSIQWSMTVFQEEVFSAIYFFGIVMGNFTSSILADRIGRKNILVISSFCTFVIVIISSFVQNYPQMIVIRFLLGLLFGLSLPLSMVVISEIVPSKIRGRFIVTLSLMFSLGGLYMIGCCQVFLTDYEHGNWRELLLFNSIPAFICFIGCSFVLRESPRFQISQGKLDEATQEIDIMIQKNHPENYTLINEEEKNALQRWMEQNQQSKDSNSKNSSTSVLDLFNAENVKVTLSILAVFFVYNLQGIGIISLLPFIYAREGYGFLPILLASLMELPAMFLVIMFIDHRWAGRKRFTFFGFCIMALSSFTIYVLGTQALVPCIMSLRFGVKIVWSAIHTLPSESYSTQYRTLGAGFAEGFGKLIGCVSPFIMFRLYHKEEYLPFLLCGFLCLLGAFFILFHPKEMTQVSLDANDSHNIDESKNNTTVTQVELQAAQQKSDRGDLKSVDMS